MELTHFSLCSGIGGLDLAAEWAGFRTIGQCEIDEYASKVLEKNFKGVHNFGDIRTITAESVGRYGIKAGEITVISGESRASHTALREKVWVILTSVTSNKSICELSENLNRDGRSLKIRQVYSQGIISDTSIEYWTTFPRWGILSHGECGELLTSEPRMKGKESSLWRTSMASDGEFAKRTNEYLINGWMNHLTKHLSEQVAFMETFPTPLASDGIRTRYSEDSLKKVGMRKTKGEYKKAGCNLVEYVAVFPSPVASGKLNGGSGSYRKLERLKEKGEINETEFQSMTAGNGGKLNPTWVEWLMGFPLGWSDLDVSEMQ